MLHILIEAFIGQVIFKLTIDHGATEQYLTGIQFDHIAAEHTGHVIITVANLN